MPALQLTTDPFAFIDAPDPLSTARGDASAMKTAAASAHSLLCGGMIGRERIARARREVEAAIAAGQRLLQELPEC